VGKLELIGTWLRELVALAIVMSIAVALVAGVAYVTTGLAFQETALEEEAAFAGPID
jgi:hypothetical protein